MWKDRLDNYNGSPITYDAIGNPLSYKFINGRIYYIFKRYEDRPTHTATLGYYAVDVFTGEVFDTKMLTDLIKL
ncbi:MAG: hypothetical protein FWF45_06575 [Coriobacteriia bacterium]|nr:hypothetical protein [Coriobacteriia bacterium]